LIEQTGTKVGFSEPLISWGKVNDNKVSYARDNRVVLSKSSYRRKCLPPQHNIH